MINSDVALRSRLKQLIDRNGLQPLGDPKINRCGASEAPSYSASFVTLDCDSVVTSRCRRNGTLNLAQGFNRLGQDDLAAFDSVPCFRAGRHVLGVHRTEELIVFASLLGRSSRLDSPFIFLQIGSVRNFFGIATQMRLTFLSTIFLFDR